MGLQGDGTATYDEQAIDGGRQYQRTGGGCKVKMGVRCVIEWSRVAIIHWLQQISTTTTGVAYTLSVPCSPPLPSLLATGCHIPFSNHPSPASCINSPPFDPPTGAAHPSADWCEGCSRWLIFIWVRWLGVLWNSLLSYLILSYQPCLSYLIKWTIQHFSLDVMEQLFI